MNATPLDEEYVMNGFHAFLAHALAQAKAERLLDEDTLASAEADIMVAGKSLACPSDPPTHWFILERRSVDRYL